LTALALVSLLLAAVPAALVCWNLAVVRAPRPLVHRARRVSVLIPARNEAANIGSAVDAALSSRDVEFEVIVLDDDSSDETANIVARKARSDGRVRLIRRRGPPPEHCGKPYACQELADQAGGEVLIFVDADVRMSNDAAAALTAELSNSDAALISGIPRQQTRSLSEKLVIPLMDFILYGYLPVSTMRRSANPAFGAACGQLIAVRRDAYEAAGGHASIAGHVHDGIALARRFRECGFRTDLIDASRIACCRMYSNWSELREGLSKNAHEGLGSPRGIFPWTAMLLGGHVMPYALLLAWPPASARSLLLTAVALGLATRALLAFRFRQSWTGVFGHAAGVATLVYIQWYALYRRLLRRPVLWKGRQVPIAGKRSVASVEGSCS
jgi:glycosyltransferase involved in cell wall biosynthesis